LINIDFTNTIAVRLSLTISNNKKLMLNSTFYGKIKWCF